MKTCYLLVSAALLTASVAAATDYPTAEAFLGYNFVRFNSNTAAVSSFDANGGNGQLAYNFSPWIGLALDIGAVKTDNVFSTNTNNNEIEHSLVNFVLGPRFTWKNHSRFKPFGQILFGAARSKSSMDIALLNGATVWPPPGLILPPGTVQPVNATIEAERTGFAMIVGGGLDIKITKHMAFRPIGADYYLTRLPSFVTGNDNNKNHFRYSAGVNFLFGAR